MNLQFGNFTNHLNDNLTAPDLPHWGVPKVEVNAAFPGYNQQLKISTTGETVTNNGAVLQQITQNFIRQHTVLHMEVI